MTEVKRAARRHPEGWSGAVVSALRAQGVRQVVYVPDNPLGHLIRLLEADLDFRTVSATREEEAVGIAAGMYLGGGCPALLMQSSGLGNSLNALGSLCIPYQIPVLLFISLRGELGEWNIAQVPMGRGVRPILDILGIQHFTLTHRAEVERAVTRAAELAFSTRFPVALILSKLLTGAGE